MSSNSQISDVVHPSMVFQAPKHVLKGKVEFSSKFEGKEEKKEIYKFPILISFIIISQSFACLDPFSPSRYHPHHEYFYLLTHRRYCWP